MEIDRIPQALEAERSILGAIMLSNGDLLDEAIDHNLTPSDFFSRKHQTVYGAMLALRSRRLPIDFTTLKDHLATANRFEQAGGASGLSALIDGVPRLDTLTYYVELVKIAAKMRRLMQVCSEVAQFLAESQPDQDSLFEAQQRLHSACAATVPDRFRRISDIATEYLNSVKTREEDPDKVGIFTGFEDLDEHTLGLQRGEALIIAARPSQGKTTFAMNISENVARAGKRVAVVSLEMTASALSEKSLSRGAMIDSYKMRSGRLTSEDWARLVASLEELGTCELWVCDEAALKAAQIKARAALLKRSHGLDVLVVDFLQLMNGSARSQSRFEAVSENVREMKNLAKELDVAVIVLSQLSRSVESRANPEPQLSDLRESGEIEQVADVVVFIYTSSDNPDMSCVKIGKNRNGPVGSFRLKYERELNRLSRS